MSEKNKKSTIKCRATRRHLLNGAETGNLQGIRVTIAYPQKRTLSDMAESINNSSSAGKADVLGVWTAMEEEIIRILSDGNRVELGSLGTLSLEVGTQHRKSVDEGITSKDIVYKGITFTPSKRLNQAMDELTFASAERKTYAAGIGGALRSVPVHHRAQICHVVQVQPQHGRPTYQEPHRPRQDAHERHLVADV